MKHKFLVQRRYEILQPVIYNTWDLTEDTDFFFFYPIDSESTVDIKEVKSSD